MNIGINISKVKNDHHSKFTSLSNWKEEAWKNQGLNGIRTRDLRDTGAVLYQFKQLERRSLKKLLKLENLLRWSLFTFIYNRSTNMNYFI